MLDILMDYGVLRHIWWGLLGVLLVGFAIMDGFDLGVATLLPFVAKNDIERRIVINTVGPFWEGNQVWLILGAGAIFAAWPAIYAASFSGFYLAMFVVMAALILRPVGFKFRSKIHNHTWRFVWDKVLFVGGFIPALLLGVAVGNVMQGVPFHFDDTLRVTYTGTFFELLNPFAVICGLISLIMMMRHGAVYLALKTYEPLHTRLVRLSYRLTPLLILVLLTAAVMAYTTLHGFSLVSPLDAAQPSNPLTKDVSRTLGGLFHNFQVHKWMMLAPLLAFGGLILSDLCMRFRKIGLAFIANGFSILGIVTIPGLSLYPFMFPSSTHPAHSLSVFDASSGRLTLFVMLIAVIIFIPIILSYTAWVYRILRGRVSDEMIERDESTYY